MERRRIEKCLKDIIRRNSRFELESIEADQLLARDLGFDSLALVLALSEAESAFEVNIPMEDLGSFHDLSFGGLVSMIVGLRTGTRVSPF